MTLVDVAKIVGVSPSTVSRVINDRPRVSIETAAAVLKAMAQLNYVPHRLGRHNGHGPNGKSIRNANILFLVLGDTGLQAVPAFEQLLRGISACATEHEAKMSIHFATKPEEIPASLLNCRIDGLLLHGEMPGSDFRARLGAIPTVWLMANRQRPAWGDEVLPDNTVAGELAASYLIERGHKHLAVGSVRPGGWAIEWRSRAFVWQVQAVGGRAAVLHAAADAAGLRQFNDVNHAAAELIDRFMALKPRPTGLFIVEDRQAMPIYTALRSHGLRIGRGGDVDIISCNNERPHLLGLDPVPATIDIRAETIGRSAVEQLVWRINRRDRAERVRTLIGPVLVAPAVTGADRNI